MRTVLFLFHRDLRLVDHGGLRQAAVTAAALRAQVVPVFVFTPEQVGAGNRFRSNASIRFMVESLVELARDVTEAGSRLVLLHASITDALDALAAVLDVGAVVETADYTPYAKHRQARVAAWCAAHAATHELVHDLYLQRPGSVRNKSGRPYQKFTPFFKAARALPVDAPRCDFESVPWLQTVPAVSGEGDPPSCPKPEFRPCRGGRREALRLLSQLPPHYSETRDFPTETSCGLGAHNHFGTVSVREVYAAFATQPELQRQLYWRDFYGHICDAFEDLYGTSPYDFNRGVWREDDAARADFEAWCAGRTGHEMVDAGMRELAVSGAMHNRVRMVCASYLAKDCKVNWRWGEAWFAQHLVDYDFAMNFGNWAWIASVLPFSQAPFRRHDPEIAAKRFDRDGEYRRKWLKVEG